MKGNENLETIYKQYLNDVFRYLLSLTKHPQTAEDLTQDTFYRAHLFLESYRGEKVKPWLMTVARNAFIDWYRREKRNVPSDPLKFENIVCERDLGPEETYLLSERIEEWLGVVNTLSPKQRQVVLLCDYYDFTYQQSAEVMKISLVDVKVSLFRGRKKVRELIDRGGSL